MTTKKEAITIKLPKNWVEHLNLLEQETAKNKDYYIQEALKRYLEDLEDLQLGLKRLAKKNKVYHTPEEVSKRLGI